MTPSRTWKSLLAVVAATTLFAGTAGIGPRRVEAALDAQACVDALRGDRNAALALSAAQATNFNRTSLDSALDKANVAHAKALKDRGDALYKAYYYAYRGSKTTANTWVTKANAAVARANAAMKTYNAQVAIVNKATTRINADRDLLYSRMDATDVACAGF